MLEAAPPLGGDPSPPKLPSTLTILPTYKCTAACKDCCFQSNPDISHRVPQDRLLDYIEQAADLGTIRLVCFSGGESFLLGEDLVELVERCSRRGLLTRVVTNGYWATSKRAARWRLSPLVEAGLNEINFSTGDDHVKFVPLERVVLGMAASLDYGMGMALMIEARAERRVTRQDIIRLAAREYPALCAALEGGRFPIIESPWMQFSPDSGPIRQESSVLLNSRNVHLREPCKSVLSTVVVTPSEELGMCCGLPREDIPDLHAGSLLRSPMADLIRGSAHDFLKIWLFVEGPEKILAWAASKDSSIDWENRYAHNCDACRAVYGDPKVMRVIERHYEEKYDGVLFKYALYLAGPPRADGTRCAE